jgi:hypothetical protein
MDSSYLGTTEEGKLPWLLLIIILGLGIILVLGLTITGSPGGGEPPGKSHCSDSSEQLWLEIMEEALAGGHNISSLSTIAETMDLSSELATKYYLPRQIYNEAAAGQLMPDGKPRTIGCPALKKLMEEVYGPFP